MTPKVVPEIYINVPKRSSKRCSRETSPLGDARGSKGAAFGPEIHRPGPSAALGSAHAMSLALIFAICTGAFMASRRKGSPSSWFSSTSTRVVSFRCI